jgi:hypothetical protein
MRRVASCPSRRRRRPSPPWPSPLPFARGQEGHDRTASASAPAGDADNRAGRGRGASTLRPTLLAVACARRADRHLRRPPAGAGRVDAADREHCGRGPSRHRHVRRRGGARGGAARRAPPPRHRLPGGPNCVHPVPGARADLRPPCDRLACTGGPLRAGRGHRGHRPPRLAAARLSAGAGRLRALTRVNGDAGNHLLPEHPRDGAGDQRRQRRGGRHRAAAGRGHSLAGGRARVEPPLLRPGRPVKVGPPTQEEPRCRPTSCSRA